METPRQRNKYIKEWNTNNKEARKKIQARYYKKNKKRINAYQSMYRKNKSLLTAY